MKAILTSSIKPMYSQEQPEVNNWRPLAEQQQQEGPADTTQQQQQSQQQQQQQEEDDPFKGLNLENMDDANKAIIEKIRVSHAATTTKQRELEEKINRVTNVAQQYQSQADKATAILKRHNLSVDGQSHTPQPSAEEQMEAQLVAEFTKEGMKEEAAKGYAKIFMKGMGVFKPSILQEVGGVLGPAVTQISTLQATQILDSMTSGEQQVAFKIPGVLEASQAIINNMIANRQPINQGSVSAAVQLAIGEVMMKQGGDASALTNLLKGGQQQQQRQQQQQQQPSILQQIFGGNLSVSGSFPAPGSRQANGAPVAANDETARLAGSIGSMWDRDLKKK